MDSLKQALYALCAVIGLILIGWIGAGVFGLKALFGIVIPYLAVCLFMGGFIYRVAKWAASPVPFHIATVCGQQRSLPWIRSNSLESPSTGAGLFGRMALEVLFFRSLLRNDRVEIKRGQKLVYGSNRYLWLGAMLFHWSLLIILIRHLRYLTDPVLPGVAAITHMDSVFQIGLPEFYLTDGAILIALCYLLFRRLASSQVRLISLPADYFALCLILAIAISGVLMRHIFKIDLTAAKALIMGIVSLHPFIGSEVGTIFFVHLFLVSLLVAYFPFSKLMHAPGIFLSPTRNLKNDSRAQRHVNPWSYPVKVHTYEEYEDEFRVAMKEAGIPLEKQ
jgi:nitrate reductase gamma subunit